MRHPKATMIVFASLVLTVLFLGMAGCGEERRGRVEDDRDRAPARQERQDTDRHDDRGKDVPREGDHGDR